MSDEERLNKIRPIIENILADLEREISKPVSMVWKCRSLARLVSHYEDCIESYTKHLAGSSEEIRQMFLQMIQFCQMEIREAKGILYSLGR